MQDRRHEAPKQASEHLHQRRPSIHRAEWQVSGLRPQRVWNPTRRRAQHEPGPPRAFPRSARGSFGNHIEQMVIHTMQVPLKQVGSSLAASSTMGKVQPNVAAKHPTPRWQARQTSKEGPACGSRAGSDTYCECLRNKFPSRHHPSCQTDFMK